MTFTAKEREYRSAQAHPDVSLLVDDPDFFGNDVIRIHPRRIISRHIDPDRPAGHARDVT